MARKKAKKVKRTSKKHPQKFYAKRLDQISNILSKDLHSCHKKLTKDVILSFENFLVLCLFYSIYQVQLLAYINKFYQRTINECKILFQSRL